MDQFNGKLDKEEPAVRSRSLKRDVTANPCDPERSAFNVIKSNLVLFYFIMHLIKKCIQLG